MIYHIHELFFPSFLSSFPADTERLDIVLNHQFLIGRKLFTFPAESYLNLKARGDKREQTEQTSRIQFPFSFPRIFFSLFSRLSFPPHASSLNSNSTTTT